MNDPQVETAEPNDCPFCLSSDYLEMSGSVNGRHYWMRCTECGTDGPCAMTRLDAITEWNGPTDTIDELRKDCDRLRNELDESLGVIR